MPKQILREILWELRDCELGEKDCPPCNVDVDQALKDILALFKSIVSEEETKAWKIVESLDSDSQEYIDQYRKANITSAIVMQIYQNIDKEGK